MRLHTHTHTHTHTHIQGVNLWELATQKLPWAEEAIRESSNGVADYEYCRRKVQICVCI